MVSARVSRGKHYDRRGANEFRMRRGDYRRLGYGGTANTWREASENGARCAPRAPQDPIDIIRSTVCRAFLMQIAIPDDYQDLVHRLRCYATLAGYDVLRYREPAADLADLATRLRSAQAIVPIRERSAFPRELIERLPNL